MLSTTHRTKFSYLRRVLVLPISAIAIAALSVSTTEGKASPVETPIAPAFTLQPIAPVVNDTTPTPVKRKLQPVKKTGHTDAKPRQPLELTADVVHMYGTNDLTAYKAVMVEKKVIDTGSRPDISIRAADKIIIERPKDSTAKKGIPTDALYLYDGRFISYEDVTKINPNDIKSINVWKGESAIKKFGLEGVNGVIELFSTKLPY